MLWVSKDKELVLKLGSGSEPALELPWWKRGIREPVEEGLYDKHTSVTVNRISIDSVEQMLIQQYNHDFPERNCDDKAELSQEDHQFLGSVSNSLQFTNGHYYIGLPFNLLTSTPHIGNHS